MSAARAFALIALAAMSSPRTTTSGTQAADPFAACADRLARAPAEYESAFCFYKVAQDGGRWDAAGRRLDALVARHPDNYWLVLTRGHLELLRRPERALKHYAEAARGFARQAHAEGEIAARYNLRNLLHRKGRISEASREVARVVVVAEASRDPQLLAQALTLEALHLTETTQDLERAHRALRRAEAAVFPGGAFRLQRTVLLGLGNVCFEMGRLGEALSHYRRLDALTEAAGDLLNAATARYNIANTRLRALEDLPQDGGLVEVRREAERALAAARASGNRDIEVMAHRTLGEVLGPTERDAARLHLEACLQGARALQQPRELSYCLWSLGRHVGDRDPARAAALVDEGLRVALDGGHAMSIAFAWRHRMRVAWQALPRDRAVAESRKALAAIESLRELQPEAGGRARLFSAWSRDYYWLSGRLLLDADDPRAGGALDVAFEVTERMRARALLDALNAGRPAAESPEPLRERHSTAQQAIVRVQRLLLEPRLAPDKRAGALRELETLEREEADARRALAPPLRSESRFGDAVGGDVFAGVQRLQERLGEDEALLSFQVGLWEDVHGEFGGGSWVLVLTRRDRRAFRLPDRVELEPAVPLFLGLIERRDGADAAAAARLYGSLLGEAIASLPPAVRRLIVVPDGALHRLPFAALRPRPEALPLASRYEITVAPSATVWLRLKSRPGDNAPTSLLVLADPELSSAHGAAAETRAWAFGAGAALGPLPHARREGRAAIRRLGGRLLVGREAAERFVKTTDLRRFGVVHFAAHAIVDDELPERSAVLLSAGSEEEDGLLQAREIASLDLSGRVVVLSACRSATGTVLRGEGVLGLARAFFQAGASAVVGSLWPLRDDEAARLFDGFYRRLEAGGSVGAALSRVQTDADAQGLPAAAWGGLVVIGHDAAPVSPASARPGVRAWTWAVVAALAFAGLLLFVGRGRRPRGH